MMWPLKEIKVGGGSGECLGLRKNQTFLAAPDRPDHQEPHGSAFSHPFPRVRIKIISLSYSRIIFGFSFTFFPSFSRANEVVWFFGCLRELYYIPRLVVL